MQRLVGTSQVRSQALLPFRSFKVFFLKRVDWLAYLGLFSCQGPAGCQLGLGFRAKSLTPHPKLYCRLSGVRSWSLYPCACNVQAKVVTGVMSRIVII